jgi:hypothetical protein
MERPIDGISVGTSNGSSSLAWTIDPGAVRSHTARTIDRTRAIDPTK